MTDQPPHSGFEGHTAGKWADGITLEQAKKTGDWLHERWQDAEARLLATEAENKRLREAGEVLAGFVENIGPHIGGGDPAQCRVCNAVSAFRLASELSAELARSWDLRESAREFAEATHRNRFERKSALCRAALIFAATQQKQP